MGRSALIALIGLQAAAGTVERFPQNPILTPASSPTIGENINGPSLIRVPAWVQLTLDVTTQGYWFMIKDKVDPCGFAYVSNQVGVILHAEPIR